MDAAFWDAVADVAAAVLLLLGAFLAFAAGVGVARFPDLLARMHAATKPQVLGLILVLLGLSLRLRSWGAVATLALVVAFQLLTSPVAAHMVGRAGYRIIAVAYREFAADCVTHQDETKLTFAGLVVLRDPPRQGIVDRPFQNPLADRLHNLSAADAQHGVRIRRECANLDDPRDRRTFEGAAGQDDVGLFEFAGLHRNAGWKTQNGGGMDGEFLTPRDGG